MKIANYHCHTAYSDGKKDFEQYIQQALKEGLSMIGFSDHAPLPLDCDWAMPLEKLPIYQQQINSAKRKYQEKIQVYYGLEVDFIPDIISLDSDHIRNAGLDYSIGSVHFVDAFPDSTPWCIDCTTNVFRAGLTQIFNGDAKAAISRYYELIRQMVQTTKPDIVGHLDRIRKSNANNQFFDESEPWYKEEILKTLKVIADSGIILEVNTKGYYRKQESEAYPRKWILEEAFKMNIPVHPASDAHHPKYIIGGFPYVFDMLQEIGYKKVRYLIDGLWEDVKINID